MAEQRIQLRRDSSTTWDNVDPVLAAGEIGVAVDLDMFKIGNGVSPWTSLAYHGATSPSTPGDPSSGGGGAATILVAAYDSPDRIKERADYVCGSSNAHTTINQALSDAANRAGTSPTGVNAYRQVSVTLADGLYNLNGPVLIPNRGMALRGTSKMTVLQRQGSGFTNAGAGPTPALIKLADTSAAKSPGMLSISTMTLHGGSAVSGVSGVVIDIEGEMPDFGAGTYGFPPTSPDSIIDLRDLYIMEVPYGIRFQGLVSGGSRLRGNQVSKCIVYRYGIVGIGGSGAADSFVWNSGTQGGVGNGAIGFETLGGNCRYANVVSTYGSTSGSTGGIGFNIASSRVFGTSVSSQDNPIGMRVTGSDCNINGFKYDTQEAAQVAVDVSASRCSIYCGDISVRGGPGLDRGLNVSSGTADHDLNFVINPANIDVPISVNNGSAIQDVSYLPRGMYRIHVAGNSGYTLMTGATPQSNGPGGFDDPDPEIPGDDDLGLVGVTTTATSSTSGVTVSLPTGLQNGDLLLLAVITGSSEGALDTPTGWTLEDTQTPGGSSQSKLFSCVMGPGVSAPYFSGESPRKYAVGVAAIRGATGNMVVEGKIAGTATTLHTPEALTAGFDFVPVSFFLEKSSNPSTTVTAPEELTLNSSRFGVGGGAAAVAVASDMTPITGGSLVLSAWQSDVSNAAVALYSIAVEVDDS